MITEVQLWGRTIGAVGVLNGSDVATFEYDPMFVRSGIEVAPLMMPLRSGVFSFPGLRREAFYGLPGMLADSLPDAFGNALIDAWLGTQGLIPSSFSPVQRLCYVGKRGMGALEFLPAIGPKPHTSSRIDVDALVQLAGEILMQRAALSTHFGRSENDKAVRDILRVGTSAGGARAKAIIAWNRTTNEVRSGQVVAPPDFEYWLLKFDGVTGNKDKELDDPKGYGAIEYAYSLMAKAAGVTMGECRLFEENGRRHFMTRRFDRGVSGEKIHMQSLGALEHFDYSQAGAYAYEQAFLTLRRLRLPMLDAEELYRRMVFNVVARNQDDHVKNISFLMNKSGTWSLAPAYDVTYSFNPYGAWTATHQMSINGKRDGFALTDLLACAATAGIRQRRARAVINDVQLAVRQWKFFAEQASIEPDVAHAIERTHRQF